MTQGPRFRTIAAIVIVAAGALAAFRLGNGVLAATVVAAAGIAAVLLAFGAGDTPGAPADRPADAPPAPPATDLSAVIEAIVEPVLIVTDGRVVLANQAARTLLGGHIVGEDVRLAIRHPAAAERLTGADGGVGGEPIHMVGLGTRDQRWEMHVARGAGATRIIHLIDQTGSYAAERMRVDFVANASHELRTPLASILGFIETLNEDNAGDEPETRHRFLGVMAGEAGRMQRLVEDLLSLSRIEAEKYRQPSQAIDLAELIEEVGDQFRDSHDPRADDIVLDLDAGAPLVTGDRVQLSQLLHNLIGNAMKYGRRDTPITVRLRPDRTNMVRLSVVDHGEGIAPEHIPRLTERFYRADTGRSRSLGGTGLGLAIVKHIVERHRGRLDIASTVGTGTTATVLLPSATDDALLSSNRHDSTASAEPVEPAPLPRDTDPADPDIGELRGLIAEMGGLAEAALDASVDALVRRDLAAARRVIEGDHQIDVLESRIERLAVRLIAARSPTGGDLREAVAALKIAAVVERIGDYAKNIAKRVAAIDDGGAIEPIAMLPAMARMAGALVHDVLDAFAARDAAAAIDVSERDRAIDDFYDALFRVLVTYMIENPERIGQVAHLLFIAKNLERVGDHATNVAEMVHYAATGQHMAERERGASPIPAI